MFHYISVDILCLTCETKHTQSLFNSEPTEKLLDLKQQPLDTDVLKLI